jgi:hypothetical protein
MVKMIEVIVRDRNGEVVKRVAVNEDLFNELLKRRMEKSDNDMTTVWFLRMLLAIFGPTPISGTISATYVDTGGSSRTQNFKQVMYPYSALSPILSNFFNTGYCSNKLWIGYGSDRTAPSRSDYKLDSKLAEGLAGVSADEYQGTLTISASFSMNVDTIIYEVGLEWEGTIASYNVCGRVLLDRTVFPDGITALAGQTITIVYRFMFP